MLSFFERLEARVRDANSLLCVGLDPRAENANDAREQCLRVIEATHEYAAAFKPNSAFFEVFGAEGINALRDVIAYVPQNIPVILDAKRGDIADTSAAYARAAFETLGAAAITVNPYLGGDSAAPFIENAAHGAFVLCKTSNAGADEFQALECGSGAFSSPPLRMTLYEIVAQRAQAWNTRNNVGLVVGATDPARLRRVREIARAMWFLVPGVGAQGGDLEATLRAGLRADGMGLLINASRSIAAAENIGQAAKELRDQINAYRGSPIAIRDTRYAIRELADDLLQSHCIRFGEFTLKSGQISPIYLDLRRLVSYPAILKRVGHAYAEILRGLEYDRIAGIPYAALPIATAAAIELNKPLLYPRRQVKAYGTQAAIEGEYNAGETVVVLDDLATTGDTKIETIEKLMGAGLRVRDIVVLIDRGQGASELLARAGFQMHAVTTLPRLLEIWRATEAITLEQYDAVKKFIEK
ncbi:MAG: orotidine-5'-phosphate decarboxylase [Chloroflexi bacterium]|nr:orotidine-5'-phosphate decarboxylase [Chloroflexota bacterium]